MCLRLGFWLKPIYKFTHSPNCLSPILSGIRCPLHPHSHSTRINFDGPLFLIAGPCVIESEAHALKMAEAIRAVARKLQMPYIFKASYDKANRTSFQSFRGPGLEEGLAHPETHKEKNRRTRADRRA